MLKGLDKTPSMHDIFTIAQTTYKQTRDCKAVYNGAESDPDSEIKISIASIKFKHNTVIKVFTDWKNITTNEGSTASYCETLESLVD